MTNVSDSYRQESDDAANASEATRQSAVRAAGATQATVTAPEILHYQNVVASSRANNNSADIGAPLAALRDLRGVSS
jgi:hypothetical protein